MIPLFITGDNLFEELDDFSKVSTNVELSNKVKGEYIYNDEKPIIDENRVLDIHYSIIFNKVNGK